MKYAKWYRFAFIAAGWALIAAISFWMVVVGIKTVLCAASVEQK